MLIPLTSGSRGVGDVVRVTNREESDPDTFVGERRVEASGQYLTSEFGSDTFTLPTTKHCLAVWLAFS